MHISESDCLADQIYCLKGIPLQGSTGRTKLTELSPVKNIMQTFNIHEAKTHLSRLVEQAAKGESFVIAKAGKPLVKVMPLNAPEAGQLMRLGFMEGQIAVPDDFDRMGGAEIEQLFGGDA